jgi:hypothetical protein
VTLDRLVRVILEPIDQLVTASLPVLREMRPPDASTQSQLSEVIRSFELFQRAFKALSEKRPKS